MNRVPFAARIATAAIGSAMLVGLAGAAVADEVSGDPEDVEVSVAIEDLDQPGVLALTVDGSTAALAETGSTDTVRQFTGQLPTVTVTDTRTAEDVPDGAAWYVLGTASSFVGDAGQPEITPDHLGWSPRLLSENDGEVIEGPQVDTVLDGGSNGVGLAGMELLSMASNSDEAIGTWEANADLVLKVPSVVAAGTYTSTITLSLFE